METSEEIFQNVKKDFIYKDTRGRGIKTLKVVEQLCKKYGSGKRVLDVGASFGYLTNHLQNKGFDVKGVDIKEWNMSEGRKYYNDLNLQYGDITKIDNEKYDIIIIIGVLEFLDMDIVELLEKIKKNLNNEGIIIFNLTNCNSLRARVKCILGLDPVETLDFKTYKYTMKRMKEVVSETSYESLEFTTLKYCRSYNTYYRVPNFLADDLIAIIKLNGKGKFAKSQEKAP